MPDTFTPAERERAYAELMEDCQAHWHTVAHFARVACQNDAALFERFFGRMTRLVALCETIASERLMNPEFGRFAARWMDENAPPVPAPDNAPPARRYRQ